MYLESAKKPDHNKTVIPKTLAFPNKKKDEINAIGVDDSPNWMTPITCYLKNEELPSNKFEVKDIRRFVAKDTIIWENLYKMRMASPIRRCLGEDEIYLVLKEVHERVFGRHISMWALTHKLLRFTYYWETLMKDSTKFLRKCDKCQRHSNLHHTPTKILHSITSLWPFY